MIYFNGIKEKNYFEGWFFRVCSEGFNCALIPSVSVEDGEKTVYIQLNCNGISKHLEFGYDEFSANDREVRIGKNRFSDEGIRFYGDDLILEADFGAFTRLNGDIMGCFRFGTPCKHKIISMKHEVILRKVCRFGRDLPIKSAVGYAEKDWGKSFPKSYCWLQCNDFGTENAAFFFSAADIGFPFRGLICSLLLNGKEYRFATYNFARIAEFDRSRIVLKKGNLSLVIRFEERDASELLAPNRGKMSNTIREDLNATVFLRLSENGKTICELYGKNAGAEWVNL